MYRAKLIVHSRSSKAHWPEMVLRSVVSPATSLPSALPLVPEVPLLPVPVLVTSADSPAVSFITQLDILVA